MVGELPLIGDVLVPRGLRLPADHWGLTVVVCGKGTSSVRRYVLVRAGRSDSASACVDAHWAYTQIAQNDQLENSERTAVWECVMIVVPESRTYLPEEDVAGRFAELVTALEASPKESPRLTIGEQTIELTSGVAEALLQVVDAIRRGLAVTVVPQDQCLTTQEAADMLGISRPTLVRLLEVDEIPFEKVRRHRRLFLTGVVEFRERQRRAANEALSAMVTDAQAMGDYDEDPAEARKVLRDLRSQN